MAILNVTPDSFSDGGLFVDEATAVEHAIAAIGEGADIIDVGGESTRPGAHAVDADEQIRRTVPVIEAIRRRTGETPISIDTTLGAVAEAALDAGASIVNDTSGGLDDPSLLRVVAQRGCGVVLMHRRQPAASEIASHRISNAGTGDVDGIVHRVKVALDARRRAACEAGVHEEQIVIDPGLGFGKSVEENFSLLARLNELSDLGRPILVGASRKSFIGVASDVERPEARLAGSLAAAVLAAERGAAILRVHSVAPHRESLGVLRWTLDCSEVAGTPCTTDAPSGERATISPPFPTKESRSWPVHRP